MREIKFRAWDKEKKEMSDDFDIFDLCSDVDNPGSCNTLILNGIIAKAGLIYCMKKALSFRTVGFSRNN